MPSRAPSGSERHSVSRARLGDDDASREWPLLLSELLLWVTYTGRSPFTVTRVPARVCGQ